MYVSKLMCIRIAMRRNIMQVLILCVITTYTYIIQTHNEMIYIHIVTQLHTKQLACAIARYKVLSVKSKTFEFKLFVDQLASSLQHSYSQLATYFCQTVQLGTRINYQLPSYLNHHLSLQHLFFPRARFSSVNSIILFLRCLLFHISQLLSCHATE